MQTILVTAANGYRDYDIRGLAKVKRACVHDNLKTGDIFNVYCEDGVKLGAHWRGTLDKSLAEFSASHPAYRILAAQTKHGIAGLHNWAIGAECGEGFAVFVDDRQLGYRKTLALAQAHALEIIERMQADGDYRLNDKPPGFLPPEGANSDWAPQYDRWRHGGWYVVNVIYPGGAWGCVSNNYPDKKWRIVGDERRIELGEAGDFTFRSRDAAARAERALANAPHAVEKSVGEPSCNEDPAEMPTEHTDYFSDARVEKIGSVMLQDLVGDYDTPDMVPEWKWIEAAASYRHARNGGAGIWEFVLNLSCTFEDVPLKLQAVLLEAKRKHLAYLIIHQGT